MAWLLQPWVNGRWAVKVGRTVGMDSLEWHGMERPPKGFSLHVAALGPPANIQQQITRVRGGFKHSKKRFDHSQLVTRTSTQRYCNLKWWCQCL
eukprot:COSAG01_NODE_166_length_23296_cov_140.506014_9_plen_94_part_00